MVVSGKVAFGRGRTGLAYLPGEDDTSPIASGYTTPVHCPLTIHHVQLQSNTRWQQPHMLWNSWQLVQSVSLSWTITLQRANLVSTQRWSETSHHMYVCVYLRRPLYLSAHMQVANVPGSSLFSLTTGWGRPPTMMARMRGGAREFGE